MTPLLEVDSLKKYYAQGEAGLWERFGALSSPVRAVDDVSFLLFPGETLGLVGESGCGKSTVARSVARLIVPTSGTIRYRGTPINEISEQIYHRRVQMTFQDPRSSLNPRKTVGDIIRFPLRIHGLGGDDPDRRVAELLEMVGLSDALRPRYPHELSGGQRQRVGIARALAVEPECLVCDEPVSALDVSVQAQILNLLADLQEELDLTYLFISHDLSTVRYLSDRVAVMYLGQIVEMAQTTDFFDRPKHPYSRALLDAVPVPDPRARTERRVLSGMVPSASDPPSGCRFHPRCPEFIGDICVEKAPALFDVDDDRQARCHLYD